MLANELISDIVVNLPRGLFLKPVKDCLLSNNETKSLATELNQKERVNASYIIEQYFTQLKKDQPKELYNYEKSYEFLNKLFDTRSNMRNALEKKYFRTEKLAELTKKMSKTERDNEIIRKIDAELEKHVKNKKIQNDNEKERVRNKYLNGYKDFTENEKQIRFNKTCDMVLFMIIDEIFRKEYVSDGGVLNKRKNIKRS